MNSTSSNTDKLGVVVIGRNEAPRLRPCLESVRETMPALVYVDSGSCDGSPAIADDLGVPVIRLDTEPFSAARGRQAGLDWLRHEFPGLEFVQFVDGDCVLQAGWVKQAIGFLDAHLPVGAVVGRLREARSAKSVWVRLVESDWDLPVGETDAIGGIAMVRTAALWQVDGWRTELVAGEELDLAARLRKRGWRLERLPYEMAIHDVAIVRLGEFWRRSVRTGQAYAQVALDHGWRGCPRWMRRTVGSIAYGAVLPLACIAGAVLYWPCAVVVAAVYVVLGTRIAGWRVRQGDSIAFAIFYAVVAIACKVASALGAIGHLLRRATGRPSRLIEYKTADSVTG